MSWNLRLCGSVCSVCLLRYTNCNLLEAEQVKHCLFFKYFSNSATITSTLLMILVAKTHSCSLFSTSRPAFRPKSLLTSPWFTPAPWRPFLTRKCPPSELWSAAGPPTHLYRYLPKEGFPRLVPYFVCLDVAGVLLLLLLKWLCVLFIEPLSRPVFCLLQRLFLHSFC